MEQYGKLFGKARSSRCFQNFSKKENIDEKKAKADYLEKENVNSMD